MHNALIGSDLRAKGIPEPWNYGLSDIVRFYELDALNHVNNVVYLKWFETTRVRYVMDYGISDFSHGPNTPTLVVRALSAEFHAPMHQNDAYIVTARTARVGRTSFQMEYTVFAPEIRVTGACTVVVLTPDSTSTMPLSDKMRQTFIDCDGATSA